MDKIKKVIGQIKKFINASPKEFWLLVFILLLGAFLRLFKIDQYMTFLGDEGRDVIIVRKIFTQLHPPLIGPGTSVGNMYLGPLYYYFMAIPLLFAGFSPLGPAVMIAVLGVITIFLVWFIGRKWFGSVGGVLAAFFYAISPTVIIFSRSSWNPNIMPFFALLSVYAIWKVWKERKYVWLISLGITLAFCLQSHYLGLLLAPALGIFWLISLINLKKEKAPAKPFVKYSLLGLIIFLFLMSPLVIFDARHGWNNFAAIKQFFSARTETVSINPFKTLPKTYPLAEQILSSLLGGRNSQSGKIIVPVLVISVVGVFLVKRKQKGKFIYSYSLLITWIVLALIGLGLYKQEVYDHYFGFLFPAPFLLLGGVVNDLIDWVKGKKRAFQLIAKIILFPALLVLVILSVVGSPLRGTATNQLRRAIAVGQKIKVEYGNVDFNFAVIADRNYEDGYEYFLQLWNLPVVDIDAQVPSTIKSQLFVVCELPKEKCSPTTSPKAQVANFGWSKIDKVWEVSGAVLYRLIHSQ